MSKNEFKKDMTIADQFGISHIKGVIYKVLDHATTDSANYAIEKMNNSIMFPSRYYLREYCCSLIKNKKEITLAEFGVWSGNSINSFSEYLPQASIFGFDSFYGLEEDWLGFNLTKGSFNLEGIEPEVKENVILYKGLYKDTVPKFINNFKIKKQLDLIHMDSDTYNPTFYVLNSIVNLIKPGSIIIFDEYFGYPNWRNHEYKAFQEFVLNNSIQYKYIAYSENSVAVEILDR